jgi:hypothetical protein
MLKSQMCSHLSHRRLVLKDRLRPKNNTLQKTKEARVLNIVLGLNIHRVGIIVVDRCVDDLAIIVHVRDCHFVLSKSSGLVGADT